MKEKAIDIVRQRLKDKIETEDDHQKKNSLKKLLSAMEETDYFFLTISPDRAAGLLEFLEFDVNEALELADEMCSNENRRGYKEYLKERKIESIRTKIKVFIKSILQ